jgi:Acyl-CoA carboxylase epsilon subunit
VSEAQDEQLRELVDSGAVGIRVISGHPDAGELAAVTAVLTGVLEELAEEQGRRELGGPSAWERSQRSVRAPVHPGAGTWRSFSA